MGTIKKNRSYQRIRKKECYCAEASKGEFKHYFATEGDAKRASQISAPPTSENKEEPEVGYHLPLLHMWVKTNNSEIVS